jgi:hypothetical protein
MTSVRITPITRNVSHTSPDYQTYPRLELKPKAPVTGAVDGGWWPRSRDLAAELPDLLAVLAVRLGTVEGVNYNLDDWGPTPRKMLIHGSRVRVGGYRSQRRDTIDIYSRRARLTLLVVAPEATASVAHTALRAAGHRANIDSVETLLRASHPQSGDDAAEQRWEVDGGPVLRSR